MNAGRDLSFVPCPFFARHESTEANEDQNTRFMAIIEK